KPVEAAAQAPAALPAAAGGDAGSGTGETAPEPPSLTDAEILQLIEFARIGYRRGIERKLAEIATGRGSDTTLALLADRLARFDMAGLIAALEALAAHAEDDASASARQRVMEADVDA
ncbi:MAG: hypothetical protein P4L82_09325, partial [Ancalomicrobiaceae bacterium]|nr:hypothetical protein [Ancalomicrobiaceae bacterium]